MGRVYAGDRAQVWVISTIPWRTFISFASESELYSPQGSSHGRARKVLEPRVSRSYTRGPGGQEDQGGLTLSSMTARLRSRPL